MPYNKSIFQKPFNIKKWQSNGYYPISRYEMVGSEIKYYNRMTDIKGRKFWHEVSLISGSLEEQIEYHLYVLNHNKHIITKNYNTSQYN